MRRLLDADNLTEDSKKTLLDIFSVIICRRQSSIQVPGAAYSIALIFDSVSGIYADDLILFISLVNSD